jgi:hypothetical protein
MDTWKIFPRVKQSKHGIYTPSTVAEVRKSWSVISILLMPLHDTPVGTGAVLFFVCFFPCKVAV